jgi:hypothetical protein
MIDPVNIEDANSLKRMGLPLSMPVEHRKFARENSKHWSDLLEVVAKANAPS